MAFYNSDIKLVFPYSMLQNNVKLGEYALDTSGCNDAVFRKNTLKNAYTAGLGKSKYRITFNYSE